MKIILKLFSYVYLIVFNVELPSSEARPGNQIPITELFSQADIVAYFNSPTIGHDPYCGSWLKAKVIEGYKGAKAGDELMLGNSWLFEVGMSEYILFLNKDLKSVSEMDSRIIEGRELPKDCDEEFRYRQMWTDGRGVWRLEWPSHYEDVVTGEKARAAGTLFKVPNIVLPPAHLYREDLKKEASKFNYAFHIIPRQALLEYMRSISEKTDFNKTKDDDAH